MHVLVTPMRFRVRSQGAASLSGDSGQRNGQLYGLP